MRPVDYKKAKQLLNHEDAENQALGLVSLHHAGGNIYTQTFRFNIFSNAYAYEGTNTQWQSKEFCGFKIKVVLCISRKGKYGVFFSKLCKCHVLNQSDEIVHQSDLFEFNYLADDEKQEFTDKLHESSKALLRAVMQQYGINIEEN